MKYLVQTEMGCKKSVYSSLRQHDCLIYFWFLIDLWHILLEVKLMIFAQCLLAFAT